MALKPAGKAMLIVAIVAVAGVGIVMSGALDKIGSHKSTPEVSAAPLPQVAEPVAERPAPAPEPAPVVQAPQSPSQYGETRQDAALDALINGKK